MTIYQIRNICPLFKTMHTVCDVVLSVQSKIYSGFKVKAIKYRKRHLNSKGDYKTSVGLMKVFWKFALLFCILLSIEFYPVGVNHFFSQEYKMRYLIETQHTYLSSSRKLRAPGTEWRFCGSRKVKQFHIKCRFFFVLQIFPPVLIIYSMFAFFHAL